MLWVLPIAATLWMHLAWRCKVIPRWTYGVMVLLAWFNIFMLVPLLYCYQQQRRGWKQHSAGNRIEHSWIKFDSSCTLDQCSAAVLQAHYGTTHHYVSPEARTVMANNGVKNCLRLRGDPSVGSARFRWLLQELGIVGHKYSSCMEIGVGAGGWTKVLIDHNMVNAWAGCSRWTQEGQTPLGITLPDHFFKHKCHAEHITPKHVDLLLSDAGEHSMASVSERERRTLDVMRIIDPWIKEMPRTWIIRVPCVYSEKVASKLESWRSRLGSGRLLRCPSERNVSPVAYFVPGVDPIGRNLRQQAWNFAQDALNNALAAPIDSGFVSTTAKEGTYVGFPSVKGSPVAVLKPHDLSASLREFPKLEKPRRGYYTFLKELGYHRMPEMGSKGTMRNRIVTRVITGLTSLLKGYNTWQTTTTLAADTHKLIKDKIDKAPKEDSPHFKRTWAVYQGIADYIRAKGGRMRRLTEEEIREGSNRRGAIGQQEKDLPYKNLGEYVDSNTWQPRVREYMKHLMAGKPILSIYNSTGKKEKKQKPASRLVWFLPATARLAEAYVFGYLDVLLEKLPYSVSGIPLVDYGDILAGIFTKGKAAVCDDIAGFDTKVGLTMLSMECAFLESLTDDATHKKEIREFYRVFAYPTVATLRENDEDDVEQVILQSQGQVASGRRITYPMNTITNVAITMGRASYSQGVSEDEVRLWAYNRCVEGHSDKYGGKISGDDSAIIMSADNITKYATANAYMNELGFPRKNLEPQVPSPPVTDLESLEFCSHNYVPVKYGKEQKAVKYMPIRNAVDIIAKASIMIGRTGDAMYEVAWARAQGLTLFACYHHIPTVRMVALSLMSATPWNIAVSDVWLGWTMRVAPWLQMNDAIRIVQECLFGGSSTLPRDVHIRDITDIGYIDAGTRARFDVNFRNPIFVGWKNNMRRRVEAIRDDLSSYGLNFQFHDWIPQFG